MDKDFVIRKAKVKDLDALTKMYSLFLKYLASLDPFLAVAAGSQPKIKERLKKTIYSPKYLLVVAEESGKLVGFALSSVKTLGPVLKHRVYGYIDDVFVDKKYRRQGLSRKLLEQSYQWFKEKKIDRVELGVGTFNKLGMKAWEKHGYQTVWHKKRKIIK